MSHKSHGPEKRRRLGRRKQIEPPRGKERSRRPLATDILILSDGTLLAHNLTPVMASVLQQLNPHDETFRARADRNRRLPAVAGATGPSVTPTP
jgi:hypothetical protein